MVSLYIVLTLVSAILLIIGIKAMREQRGRFRWLDLTEGAFIVPSNSGPGDLILISAVVLIGSLVDWIDVGGIPPVSLALVMIAASGRVIISIGYHDPVTLRPEGVTVKRLLLPSRRCTWAELDANPNLLHWLRIDPLLVRPATHESTRRIPSRTIFGWIPAIHPSLYAAVLRGYLDDPWRRHLIGTGAEYDRLRSEITRRPSTVAPVFVEPQPD